MDTTLHTTFDTATWEAFFNGTLPELDPNITEVDPEVPAVADGGYDIETLSTTPGRLLCYSGAESPYQQPVGWRNEPSEIVLSPAGQNYTLGELVSDMDLLKQTIAKHVKIIKEVSSLVEQASQRVNRLKAVYDELIPWSLQIQEAVSLMARDKGFTDESEAGPAGS